jgi:uncharacterized phage protein (TIGR01671 family)
MTRVIKFRAWDGYEMLKDVPTWTDDFTDMLNETFKMWANPELRFQHLKLMQFTGLVDKNGKEVFEGDVVRWGMNKVEDAIRYAVVEFNPDIQFRILFYFDEKINKKIPGDNYIFHYARFAYSDTEKYLEVIGNIYENGDIK